jgi:tripartite-type tricarboxylate transporter receptor subunit TctC
LKQHRRPRRASNLQNQSGTWSAHALDCVVFSRVIKGNAMKIPRRQFLNLAGGAAALPAVSRIARAQSYPTRPVRIVVGFTAGGTQDILARLMGQWLTERLGQAFIVENRLGAGSNIAVEAVVKASPDGHTLLLFGVTNAINATLYGNLNFNFIRDIQPIAVIARGPFVMVVNPSSAAKSVSDLIAIAKANPGKINFASGGVGASLHLCGELLNAMSGIHMIHVPYRGEAAALTELLGAQVDVMFATLPPAIEQIRSGKLRALAVTSATRLDVLPSVPTMAEFVSGYEASGWQRIGAPKSTPFDIVDKLNKEINAALADPKMKARLADLGATPLPGSPGECGKLIAEETEKWGKVIRAANIKVE